MEDASWLADILEGIRADPYAPVIMPLFYTSRRWGKTYATDRILETYRELGWRIETLPRGGVVFGASAVFPPEKKTETSDDDIE